MNESCRMAGNQVVVVVVVESVLNGHTKNEMPMIPRNTYRDDSGGSSHANLGQQAWRDSGSSGHGGNSRLAFDAHSDDFKGIGNCIRYVVGFMTTTDCKKVMGGKDDGCCSDDDDDTSWGKNVRRRAESGR